MGTKMSKKSVVTITVMACLLAVAVATTIVLAAFQAQKTATTTITFSNGVQIRVDGAYLYTPAANETPASSTADVVSKAATLVWGAKEGDAANFQQVASITNVSNIVTMEPIKIVNGNSSQSTTAWFIAKATIGAPTGGTALTTAQTNAISITRANTWTQIGSTDWYAYTGNPAGSNTDITLSGTALDMADVALEAQVPFVTAASINPANGSNITIDDLAGAVYEAKIEVYAVNAGASDAQTVLQAIVTPTP